MILIPGRQQVVPKAYRWLKRMGPGGWYQDFLVLPPDWPGYSTPVYYALMDRTALFIELAATEPTKEGILAFVNRNGPLGGRVSLATFDSDAYLEDHLPGYRPSMVREHGFREKLEGEALVDWRSEIESLRALYELWQTVLNPGGKGRRALRDLIERVKALPPPRQAWEDLGEVGGERPISSSAADLATDPVRAGSTLLATEVNRRLDNELAPQLEWMDGHRRGFVLGHRPQSLVAAIWLQFAHAICWTRNEFQKCDMCPTHFEVSRKRGKSAKRHCSDACRLKAARVRMARVFDLNDEGNSVGQIAEIVGSDVDTVTRWIEDRRKRHA